MLPEDESPIAYANQLWKEFVGISVDEELASKAQFFTSSKVAKYMSSMIPTDMKTINLLEAGAGTGILTAAVAEKVSKESQVEEMEVDLYEIDPLLCTYLRKSMNFLRNWLSKKGISLKVKIKEGDFIVQNEHLFNFSSQNDIIHPKVDSKYSSAIINPPYFKINKSDKRTKIASKIIHGQPNIYALFLMLTALMLKNSGTLVSITPRSFTSGLYFKKFRKYFFTIMHPTSIHVFTARDKAFKSAGVLQEIIIMRADKNKNLKETRISVGSDNLQDSKVLTFQTDSIYRETDGNVLFLPSSISDFEVVKAIESWPETFQSMGLKVSTGPIVPFRLTEYITANAEYANAVPLLWMRNIRDMNIIWPWLNKKSDKIGNRQYIKNSEDIKNLLRPTANYVLLHRFSSKEQKSRFTAAYLDPDNFPFEKLGFENHLNYVYRPDGTLEKSECIGIVAILNSMLLDIYIRARSGSTQINASDMKFLPLPEKNKIINIGQKIQKNKKITKKEIELLVLDELNLKNFLQYFSDQV